MLHRSLLACSLAIASKQKPTLKKLKRTEPAAFRSSLLLHTKEDLVLLLLTRLFKMYHPPKRSSSPPPTSAFPSTRGSFPTRRAWRGSNAYRGQGSRSSHWGRGTYFTGNKTSNPAIDRSPSPPVGSLLREINYKDIEGGLQFDTGIKHCEDIASYNWVSEKHPTILVPGRRLDPETSCGMN